ncbi:MAG: AMIN domain-containing protein [Cyanobacteria bacterium P01_E01_bin.6]
MFPKKLNCLLSPLYRLSMTALSVHGVFGGISGVIALGAATVLVAPAAYAGELTTWRFDPDTRQLELTLSENTTPNYFLLAQPTRIVLDLPNTVVDTFLEEESFQGVVRHIRVSQFQPTLARIVIELAPGAELSPSQVELRPVVVSNGNSQAQWVMRPLLADEAIASLNEPASTSTRPEQLPEIPNPEPTDTETATIEQPNVTLDADDADLDDLDSVPVLAASTLDTSTLDTSTPDASTPDASIAATQDDRDEDLDTSIPDQSETITAQEHSLPPLEPGGFEIPVEIPPPLPEIAENRPNLGNEANNERFVVSDESQIAIILEPQVSENVESIDGSNAASSSQETEQIAVGTRAELRQALEQALPEGTTINIVGRNDQGSNSAESDQPSSVSAEFEDSAEFEEILPGETLADIALPEPETNTTIPEESNAVAPAAETLPWDSSLDVAAIEDDREPGLTVDSSVLPMDGDESVLSANSFEEDVDNAEEENAEEELNAAAIEDTSPESVTPESVTPELLSDDATDDDVTDVSPANTENSSPEVQDGENEDVRLENNTQTLSVPSDTEDVLDNAADSFIREEPIEPSGLEPQVLSALPPEASVTSAPDLPIPEQIDSAALVESQPLTNTAIEPPDIEPDDETAETGSASFPSPITDLETPIIPSRSSRLPERELMVAARPGARIPSGTVLRLRYPRLTPTLLPRGMVWQDVLLLEQTLLDQSGNVIATEGTEIIGRFELTPQSIRFVTQAIALDGRNIALQAVSGWVPISQESQAVVIHPNQIVNVRLAEHFDQ